MPIDESESVHCQFSFHFQLRPAHVIPGLLEELETELENPTGLSTIPSPPLFLDTAFISKPCGILVENRGMKGLKYVYDGQIAFSNSVLDYKNSGKRLQPVSSFFRMHVAVIKLIGAYRRRICICSLPWTSRVINPSNGIAYRKNIIRHMSNFSVDHDNSSNCRCHLFYWRVSNFLYGVFFIIHLIGSI